MNRANAARIARDNVVQNMQAYMHRTELAKDCAMRGETADAQAVRCRARESLEKVAEALSIENHVNGVSPE